MTSLFHRPESIGLASFSHISSVPGIIFPVERLIALCHKHGVLVLIDGAHCPGQIVLDIPKLGADFYVADLHKWFFNPRGSSFIWAAKSKQGMLLPNVADHGPGKTPFERAFEWQGTVDNSNFAAVTEAVKYRESLGGEAKITEYIHTLAVKGGKILSSAWGTEVLSADNLFGGLVNVRVPCTSPCTVGGAPLMQALWEEAQTIIPIGSWGQPDNSVTTLPTKNQLEDTGGLLRPPPPSTTHQRPLGAVASCPRFLLTRVLS